MVVNLVNFDGGNSNSNYNNLKWTYLGPIRITIKTTYSFFKHFWSYCALARIWNTWQTHKNTIVHSPIAITVVFYHVFPYVTQCFNTQVYLSWKKNVFFPHERNKRSLHNNPRYKFTILPKIKRTKEYVYYIDIFKISHNPWVFFY